VFDRRPRRASSNLARDTALRVPTPSARPSRAARVKRLPLRRASAMAWRFKRQRSTPGGSRRAIRAARCGTHESAARVSGRRPISLPIRQRDVALDQRQQCAAMLGRHGVEIRLRQLPASAPGNIVICGNRGVHFRPRLTALGEFCVGAGREPPTSGNEIEADCHFLRTGVHALKCREQA